MQCIDGTLIYSATDLNNYLECKRLTDLEALLVRGKVERPPQTDDEQASLIRRKGDEHESRHLNALLALHPREVKQFERADSDIESYRSAEQRTQQAMRDGARIIYQATFFDGQFIGHADFLRRVEVPSALGGYSYEVVDTKLALSTKPYFLVQLCNYSEHLERLQGCAPTFGHIVLGNDMEQPYRLHDYMAYYRQLKSRFLEFVNAPTAELLQEAREYPVEVKHCAMCSWDETCKAKRIDDDHLSLVAWMRRDQTAKLEEAGIRRVTELAVAADDARPTGMNSDTFSKLRRQARLQVHGRASEKPLYELLAHEPPLGFAQLPHPAPGDVFFDMEGDPLYEPGRVLEYLFGCWKPDDKPHFRAFWGTDRAGEKRAFQDFVDFVTARRRRYPAMHIYHYASYEKTALRRLAQEHATREDEIDDLLRGEVLVDLFAVVRQALMISEDGYGLKKLERFYDLKRTTDVQKGDESIVMFERWLLDKDPSILDDIQSYNCDDCRSTYLLRGWLLELRVEAIAKYGVDLPLRAVRSSGDPCHADFLAGCKTCDKRRDKEREEARLSDLEKRLLKNVLAPQSEGEYRLMQPERRSEYLMGNLLAYHRREERPAWWEYYDRCENVDRLREFDKDAIGELELVESAVPYQLRPKDRNLVYTYRFPEQQHKMGLGDAHNPRTKSSAGKIVKILDDEGLLHLKRKASTDEARAITELIPRQPLSTAVQRGALSRVAQSFAAGRLEKQHRAAFDLLSARDPRATGIDRIQPEHVTPESVSAIVQALDESYLFIQGPPGSGKSTTASKLICDLLTLGKRVAVMSNGHKAIHNLLRKVEACMTERRASFRGIYKHSDDNDGSEYVSGFGFIQSTADNLEVESGVHALAAGTSWLFAREALTRAFDYLFIDEAGQVALADAIAASPCARNVVLLGDPSQLAQVSQGRQPLHVGDSVLGHLLGEAATVPEHRGIFLDVSYRMQPEICRFISDAFYDDRLKAYSETTRHRVTVGDRSLAGLYFVPVEHTANSASSAQEADFIVEEIATLLRSGVVVDSQPRELAGRERLITNRDIMVITPYNAQRLLILRKLRECGIGPEAGTAIRVGTVDKFQGQEAAVVFYSMATSSGEDVPRGMAFLFDRNRFNVAVSRARAASILVCSRQLLDVNCGSTEEMALANLLCAYAEEARRDVG
jgi:predicted RecB family nuclease